jgi:hypothetical protein
LVLQPGNHPYANRAVPDTWAQLLNLALHSAANSGGEMAMMLVGSAVLLFNAVMVLFVLMHVPGAENGLGPLPP